MTLEKIKKIFEKNFSNIGERIFYTIKKSEVKNSIYTIPIENEIKFYGSIVQIANIKYGNFFEQVIKEFLKENNFNLLNENNEYKNIDLLFSLNNDLYIAEVKVRDNHDSTKRIGQISNLLSKSKKIKSKFSSYKIHSLIYFIDETERKNYSFYINEYDKYKENFNSFNVFYGDELFKHLNIIDNWLNTKKNIKILNDELKNNKWIMEIIKKYKD
ncbi:hypothetical protein [Mesomycoplasma lagogenitalium]|uniref:type II site-specific deoxyribonuclease n=1 Tax=Mesomycoplasma lagogenitalium TaxID=171286 RepID=A0ABY8LU52_9BACT|nr:hypothetical protein [Mesomycoplasma lagogenitalium]WGI36772.1 hypothetical protein QEG99_00580 [Mesomycoplasma lagogenitalium]